MLPTQIKHLNARPFRTEFKIEVREAKQKKMMPAALNYLVLPVAAAHLMRLFSVFEQIGCVQWQGTVSNTVCVDIV